MPTESTPSASTAIPSPLAEADARSLEELFSRDPFEMLAEDECERKAGREPRNFPTIVAALRRQRENWKKAEQAGAVKGAAKAPRASKVQVSLADLGLDD